MSRIFLDTNFFIYLIEGGGSPQSVRARYLVRAFSARRDEVFTSVMSLGEVLVAPLRNGDHALAQQYRRIFRGRGIAVVPFVEQAAEMFARIRLAGVKPPDAIQLSTASTAGCDLFLTNDDRLQGINVPGIHFISTFDKAPI